MMYPNLPDWEEICGSFFEETSRICGSQGTAALSDLGSVDE